MSLNDLIKKYNVPVPRYTSYPTVPYWDVEKFSTDQWLQAVTRCFDETNEEKGISLYVHLPFCESLCTYCACNTRITKNHNVEDPYRAALISEWKLYQEVFGKPPVLRELHLGGGTPTFFAPENLEKLLRSVFEHTIIHPDHEFSVEGHPNNTTEEHLQTLYHLGFRRVSYGVQDLDPIVQQAIHRIQPFENLERVTKQSRAIGYTSISFDLIYGLPYQTVERVTNTVKQVLTLRPDRIAFYSYAHVPWIKPGQRGYEDANLPDDAIKRALYETGRNLFKEAGYVDIGMDHFALPEDSLTRAQQAGNLHRNFMGYTTTETDLLIGLGTSAISDARYGYAQNLKTVEGYSASLQQGTFPVFKGHLQTREDILMRRFILDMACKGRIDAEEMRQLSSSEILDKLIDFQTDGILKFTENGLKVTDIGRIFIRNVCSAFDLRMRLQHRDVNKVFSKAI
jgi:oxygen-independent coproporphyrinogen-3 oxidase